MDIRRLIEYRDILVNKKNKTVEDYRMIAQIDMSIGILNSSIRDCSKIIVEEMSKRDTIYKSTNIKDLPFRMGHLEVDCTSFILGENNKDNISIYDIQKKVDDITKIDDSNRRSFLSLTNGLRVYNEQVSRLLREGGDCSPEELFYKDLDDKKGIVLENRKEILLELFMLPTREFSFGYLTHDEMNELWQTTDMKAIENTGEMIAKYATLSELEDKQYRKILSRFQIK